MLLCIFQDEAEKPFHIAVFPTDLNMSQVSCERVGLFYALALALALVITGCGQSPPITLLPLPDRGPHAESCTLCVAPKKQTM